MLDKISNKNISQINPPTYPRGNGGQIVNVALLSGVARGAEPAKSQTKRHQTILREYECIFDLTSDDKSPCPFLYCALSRHVSALILVM